MQSWVIFVTDLGKIIVEAPTQSTRELSRRQFIAGACATALLMKSAAKGEVGPISQHQLADDPQRPQFHLLPAANWMNDPDGPLFWRGNYHMFYQYNPDGAYWGNMHWGHAISSDMVHWKHLPIALSPTAGGPDAAGCFTGTAVVRGNKVAVVYTGVTNAIEKQATIRNGPLKLKEMQCLAIGSGDDLLTWDKQAVPVIRTMPKGLELTGFRDPSPWRSKDIWYMVVGSGIRKKYGVVLLYRSKDLQTWEYMHIAATGEWSKSLGDRFATEGDMWECPDLFEVNGKWVLIYSTGGKAFWQSGDWDSNAMRFRPRRLGLLDYGCMYAPKTQLDRYGKRILWGWIRETRPESKYRAAGWAGVMSLPRVIEVDREYNLVMRVAPEVELLRQKPQVQVLNTSGDSQTIRRDLDAMRIRDLRGEIKCSFKSRTKVCGLFLETVGADKPVTWMSIEFDPTKGSQLSINDRIVVLPAENPDGIDLRVIVDASVMEIFVGTSIACTDRFYFAAGTPELRPRIGGPLENLAEFSIWEMAPISNDRLTS